MSHNDGTLLPTLGAGPVDPNNPVQVLRYIDELLDVDTTGLQDNDILYWDDAAQMWLLVSIPLDGLDGSDGNTIMSGAIDPTTEGVSGDWYINYNTWEMWGPKAGSDWGPNGQSLIGPQGEQGIQGIQGIQGTQGIQGDSGDLVTQNYVFDSNQTPDAGTDDFVLTYDHATGKIILEASGGAITVQDDGADVSSTVSLLNFVGFDITEPVADQITISGGGGGAISSEYDPSYPSYTRVDDDTFTIDGVDARRLFGAGSYVKIGDGAGAYVYGHVSSNSYAASNTTVNLNMVDAAVLPTPVVQIILPSGNTGWSPIGADPFSGTAIRSIVSGTISGTVYWVIVGDDGKAAYSTDAGLTWTTMTTPTADDLNDVVFHWPNNTFYAVGENRTFLKSTDGITWTAPAPPWTTHPSVDDNIYSIQSNYTGNFLLIGFLDVSGSNMDLATSQDEFATQTSIASSFPPSTRWSTAACASPNSAGTRVGYWGALYPNSTTYYYTSRTDQSASTDFSSLGTTTRVTHWAFNVAQNNGFSYCGGSTGFVGQGEVASTEWTDTTTFSNPVNAFAYSEFHGRTICVGENAQIGYLEDADRASSNAWTACVGVGFDPLANLEGCHYDETDQMFIVVADNGQIARSASGTG